MSDVTVRPLREDDLDPWLPMFSGYCQFYGQSCDEAKRRTVWKWLMDPDHMLRGIVAEDERGSLQGFAHFHPWPSTLAGADVCYLSDLFVAPTSRGKRIGKRLYLEVFAECKRQGWPALELLTQASNKVGQGLYDQYGQATDFMFYVSPVPE